MSELLELIVDFASNMAVHYFLYLLEIGPGSVHVYAQVLTKSNMAAHNPQHAVP